MTSKRRKWLFVLLGVIAVVALLACLTHDTEPSYHGKSLTAWLDVYANQRSYDAANDEAGEAIRVMGTNALPFLLKWVRYEGPSPIETVSKSVVARLPQSFTPPPVQRWLYGYPGQVRADYAAEAFGELRGSASPAIPELAKLMNDRAKPYASRRAVWALALIGEDSLPILIAQLADTNAINRRDVANRFGRYPAPPAEVARVIPVLVRCLDDQDHAVAFAAVQSLARMADSDQVLVLLVVPALTNCLRPDAPQEIRVNAAWALGQYDIQAPDVVRALTGITNDPDPLVRTHASTALRYITRNPRSNAPPQ